MHNVILDRLTEDCLADLPSNRPTIAKVKLLRRSSVPRLLEYKNRIACYTLPNNQEKAIKDDENCIYHIF